MTSHLPPKIVLPLEWTKQLSSDTATATLTAVNGSEFVIDVPEIYYRSQKYQVTCQMGWIDGQWTIRPGSFRAHTHRIPPSHAQAIQGLIHARFVEWAASHQEFPTLLRDAEITYRNNNLRRLDRERAELQRRLRGIQIEIGLEEQAIQTAINQYFKVQK